jgi:hypothetical protein
MGAMTLHTWLLAFSAMALLDVAWVQYMRSANEHRPAPAAIWAGLIHGFGAVAAISYIGDHRYLTATMAGTVLGTFAIVWRNRRRDAARARGEALAR